MSIIKSLDINHVVETLESLQLELNNRLAGIQSDLNHGRSQDSQEQAQETENDEVLHALAADARKELIEIDNAFSRIRNGTYGCCAVCGDSINPDRLTAYPMAVRCMDCVEI